jgi:hypothetical protein
VTTAMVLFFLSSVGMSAQFLSGRLTPLEES